MKFPQEMNPRIETVVLPNAATPAFRVFLTFKGQEHEYLATEDSNFAALNILLQAAEDGYGDEWVSPTSDQTME